MGFAAATRREPRCLVFYPFNFFAMTASPQRRFSSICPHVQTLVVRLIQEEFTPLLTLATTPAEAAWVRAIKLVDPNLLYCTDHEPTIKICPDSYQQMLAHLQRELATAE